MFMYKNLIVLLVAGLALGCGGGGSSDGVPDQTSAKTGVFVDAAVFGLKYASQSYNGITDKSGKFQYRQGEMVTFSVGDIVIGEARGADVVTPLDLVSGATDENDTQVTNIIRFLQSLDDDRNLTNGITIEARTHNYITGQSLDFSLSIDAFEAAFNTISDAVLGGMRLVDVDAARTHFRNALDQLAGGGYAGNNKYGGVSLSGVDVDKIGSLYEPEMVSVYPTDISISVSWTGGNSKPENVGRLAGISVSRIGNDIQILQLSVQDYRNDSELISYIYNIQCYPIKAPDCSKVILDETNKRLIINSVTLTPFDSSIVTNSATGPVAVSGTLYWE